MDYYTRFRVRPLLVGELSSIQFDLSLACVDAATETAELSSQRFGGRGISLAGLGLRKLLLQIVGLERENAAKISLLKTDLRASPQGTFQARNLSNTLPFS